MSSAPPRVAIVGSGISGLAVAHTLQGLAEVTLFEAGDYFGGHTHTVDITLPTPQGPVSHGVDTGFLVFNERTYPGLIDLFARLDVPTVASDMSFSARVALPSGRALEWAGTDLNSVFAQRRNLLRPTFLRMLADMVRFNRQASAIASTPQLEQTRATLGEFLETEHFSQAFRDWYLLPMAAAIWSCPTRQMMAFPVATFVRFFHNHGLLQIEDRPQWRTVAGGARQYVDKLAAGIGSVRLEDPVQQVRRGAWNGAVTLQSASGTSFFDQVVFACHSDQALALLHDASDAERAILGAVRYQANRAVLHTDAAVLPRAARAWAAWNYESAPDRADPEQRSVCVHYLINKLQPVPFKRPVMVSLNPFNEPRADSILAEFDYAHPVFDHGAITAQRRLHEIQGERATWFCGAWTGYGFHEDGLKSGMAVAHSLADLGQTRLAA